ncbi:MAG: D-alanyl-D-alanine carboxypeptidase family protein [Halomonas sp.]|uniref:D-alanyl-D-alanine carboxypeptidase family protein n=1 Tax=Halomonas sp. TaxID=1486246 RepID=UPI003F96BAEB
MAIPPFDPSNEPLGSSDPRIRDLNTRNLDRALNANEPGKWWDRFGLEHPTLWLLGQLQAAANAIVGGGDDITQAWQSAIQDDIAFRIPESATAYTSSLADGGPENRPPLQYSDRVVGASGLTFSIEAPSIVARRAMVNVPINTDRVLEVSVLTGLNAQNQALANGLVRFCLAWFNAGRERMEVTPETIFLETSEPLSASSYTLKFTVGSKDTDVVPPAGAIYCIPYFEYTGEGFEFFASELSIRDITQRRQIESLERAGYRDLLSIVDDETHIDLFDLANPALLSTRPILGQPYPDAHSITSDASLSALDVGDGPAIATRVGKILYPGQSIDTAGRLAFYSDRPLLPETGDFTLFFSCMMEGSTTGARPVLWQHGDGQPGRVQMSLNSIFTGSAQAVSNENFQMYINGITGGSGAGGQPAPANVQRGSPCNVVAIFREGEGQSELLVNGDLIDTFTRPPVIYQTLTRLLNASAQFANDHRGFTYGRIGVMHRAIDREEAVVAGQWAADAYNDKWEREVLGSSDALPNALAAVSCSIIRDSVPKKIGLPANLSLLFSRSPKQILYPASMTKVMTSILLLKKMPNVDATLEMQEGDQTAGSGNNINPGDIITVSDAIYNMMLPSSNVTTTVIARVIGTMLLSGSAGEPIDRFVEEMNIEAKRMGMYATNFTNPSGLANSAMVTTAEDMCILCAAVPNYPAIFERWGATDHTLNILGPNARQQIIGHSAGQVLNARDDIQGGKTGTVPFSPQGDVSRNFMWIGKAPNGNYTANVVMLTVDEDRYADANALQDFVFENLRWPMAQSGMS